MGAMTESQMEAEIRANLGDRTDLDSRLVTFINWAQEEIARQHTFRELQEINTSITTTADLVKNSLPTGTRNLISIRLLDGTSSRKVIYVPSGLFDKNFPSPAEYATSRPTHYTLYGDVIYWWRVPNDAYSVELKRELWPTALTAASATVSDLENLDEAICGLATAKALKSIGADVKKVSIFMKDANFIIKEAIRRDKTLYADQDIRADYNFGRGSSDYWLDPFVRRSP